jgi:hypothetical protein
MKENAIKAKVRKEKAKNRKARIKEDARGRK